VKLPDANVLLHACESDSPQDATCRPRLEAALNSDETVSKLHRVRRDNTNFRW
jgi:hypothetical protein